MREVWHQTKNASITVNEARGNKSKHIEEGRRVGQSPQELDNNWTKGARARRVTVQKRMDCMSKSTKNENYDLRGSWECIEAELVLHSFRKFYIMA